MGIKEKSNQKRRSPNPKSHEMMKAMHNVRERMQITNVVGIKASVRECRYAS